MAFVIGRIFQGYVLLLLTNELAWRLLPRWLAGCLAQRAVPQMVSERARRSEWVELPFVPPPHPRVITRTTKQPQVSVGFVLQFPCPSLIPCDAASNSSCCAGGTHHCRSTSCLRYTVLLYLRILNILPCTSIMVPSN